MKFLLIILLVGSFLGVAVFSVFAMAPSNDHSHTGCIATTVNGTDCPKESPFSFLAFHFDAFQNFSTATFADTIANALLLFVFALAMGIGLVGAIQSVSPMLATSSYCRRFFELNSFSFHQEFTRWLAFHETSPTFS